MHLFSKENIWSNPHSCNNNSVDRIISKEEEREDPRRELQSIFEYSGVSTNNTHPTRTTVFQHAIQQLQVILHTELILLQEILQLQGSSRADHYKASSSNCSPCLQAFYTAESSHKAPYSIPGPYSTSRLPVILPSRNSILSGSQHPRTPYSSSQASSTLQNSTRRNRILFKRVKYCISNTILRSVCSNLFILVLRIILQEI